MTLLGSVDIPFTKSTKIAVDATDTAGQAATVAQQATDTAGQAQVTAQTASQTATQAAATAADAAQAAQTAITTANGKNKAYYGATTPTSPQSGDIWFVEDSSGNVTAIKHYDGTQWVTDVDNTALEQQISAAQAAADNAVTVGQTAQQTAADAEAKGDAAANAAKEAKDAATKAQADAASAVTSANNAVNTANKATQDAQDAIDKAQDGFDAAQNALITAGTAANDAQSALSTASTAAKNAQSALTAANNATDTANTAKQVASDAATQASTAKTNAQTAMSNAQDAINKANAANANANTREKAIIKSNAAPSNPATDQLWIDTSKTPQIMRRWNGNTWVDLSPTQASQIGAVSTTTYTTDITNINNTLSQKASVTTVNTLSGRVDKAETAITQNANDIALKADKNVVDTLKNTVDNHSTLISQNANAIEQKANASTVDTLTGRVSTAEATLKTQANEIAARITKTDADAKYATQTALTATANSLTSNISAVQTNIDNLQVGGRNYIKNSDFKNGETGFRAWAPGDRTGTRKIVDVNDLPGFTKGYQITVDSNSNSTFGFAQDAIFVENEEYTLSCFVKTNADTVINLEIGPDDTRYHDKLISVKANAWTRISYTYEIKDSDDHKVNVYFGFAPSATSGTSAIFTGLQFKKGNVATDWTPAPEDMATVVQFNTLSQTLDSTVSRIGNAEGNISALQQTANSFATRISNAEGNISTLTQTAQGLQTTVAGKVDKTTYNSFVTQTSQALQSKLSATDAANKYATQSQLTQTASSLTSQITSVQTNIDNLQIGGRNLVPNSTGLLLNPDGKTAQFWQDGTISHKNADGTTSLEVINSGTSEIMRSGTVFNVEPNTTYIFRAKIKGSTNSTTMDVFFLGSKTAKTGIGGSYDYIHLLATGTTNKNDWQEYITKFTTNSDEICGYVRIDNNASSNGSNSSVYFSQIKLEKGTKATDWSPAPEDMATQSQITQLANDINLRVKQNDVINQINISTEGILIDGKKVHITGQTTIDNAVIKDAMIQSMTANKLTAGTIDANVITVKNINASNIVTGTLDASKATVTNIDASKITTGTLNAARIAAGSIDASKLNVSSLSAISANLGTVTAGSISGVSINIGNGNFTVDTSGNLVAKNANITGVINATAGKFSGTLEGASGTFAGTVEGATIKSSDRPSFSDPNFTNRAMLSNGTLSIESRNDTFGAYGRIEIDSGRVRARGVPSVWTAPDSYKPPEYSFTDYGNGYIYSIEDLYITANNVMIGNSGKSYFEFDVMNEVMKFPKGSISGGLENLVITSESNRICFGADVASGAASPLSILAWSDHGRIEGITGVSMNTLDSDKYSNFYASVLGEFRVTDVSSDSTYKPVRASSFPTGSLAEFKTEITKWEASALGIINSADIYQYRLKDDVKNGKDKVRHGLVIGEGYRTPAEVIDGDGVEQYEMNSLSWKAIQELSASDSSNKERLSILEEQNNNLLLKIADLEARLAKLEA